ncbi:MAG: SanA/YdcF family protein [Bacillota bacterium]
MKKIKKRIIMIFIISVFSMISGILYIDYHVSSIGKKMLVKPENTFCADAILILGAYVHPGGKVSGMLADRLNHGYELYKAGKAPKIVVSGDHGQKSYDEVNAMRIYLENKGVPREDIFMDHAGFNTYDSIYRLRDIFLVEKAIIVSQEYHTLRALYIAERLGVDACGVGADTYIYPKMAYYRFREVGARLKAFITAGIFKPEPKYLGKTIPIWLSGTLTDDGK